MRDEIRSYLLKFLDSGKRMDGRNLLDFRQPMTVEYGISATAEGSAKVTIGDTVVLAGVKVEMGKPYPDTPDQGTIMIGAELVPMSNPEFEPGPPTIKAVELARVVDRGIRESKAIDFKKLCVEPGEKAWTVMIDIVTLNDAGNLLDASGLAVLAALKDMKFPEMVDGVIDYKKKTENGLNLLRMPIPVTVFKIGKHLIVDPTNNEEKNADARLTVTTMENGELCALQKGGDTPLTNEDVSMMIDIAADKSGMLRSILG